MFHHKFSVPWHRSLCKVKSLPKHDPSNPIHLTSFFGYKAVILHAVCEVNRPRSKVNKKEVAEATSSGLCTFKTIFAEHINDECKSQRKSTTFIDNFQIQSQMLPGCGGEGSLY
uniref:Uncharacterized protein n=1 Tax=Chelonoidis abingdonii TaxID=106734 RepID=A0A8C0GQZ5_CHEAB